MAITLSTAARNAAAAAVGALANGGTAVFMTAADVVVATAALSATAFGAPSNGTITANAIAPATITNAGTVAKFDVRTSANAMVFSGSVTEPEGGGDATMPGLVYAEGEALDVISVTYTQQAAA